MRNSTKFYVRHIVTRNLAASASMRRYAIKFHATLKQDMKFTASI